MGASLATDRRANRPWWEGGAGKISPLWETGLVACYHPYAGRKDMGGGIIKCGTCWELWRDDRPFWPPTTAPR